MPAPVGEEIAWEAQEYFALGSLRTLSTRPFLDDQARAVIAALSDCLVTGSR